VTLTATSKDGTKIAYDKVGRGPVLVMVWGALSSRTGWAELRLVQLLAPSFTVINYDRRGRGESTDTLPYSPGREVEDIGALLNEFGGPAYLYGISSGAALALKAAKALGRRITKLAIYEPRTIPAALASGQRGNTTDCLESF